MPNSTERSRIAALTNTAAGARPKRAALLARLRRPARSVGVGLLGAGCVVAFAAAALSQTLTPLAAIQADVASYVDQVVTVEAQVYIRTNFNPFGSASGYVEDESGRGINLFGTGADNAAFTGATNRVRLTGEVKIVSGSTVGLTNLTNVSVVSTGGSVTPIRLGTLAASNAAWEGTRIEVNGTILTSASVSGGRNYQVDDGTGVVVVRVLSAVSGSTIPNGTRITARGAGTATSGVRQILVGAAADIFADTPPADTVPPALLGAWSPNSRSDVHLTFGEAIDPTTGGDAANYRVFETAAPGNTIDVSTAIVSGPLVHLTLASQEARGTAYTVRVSNVRDTSNNAITTPAELAFTSPVGDVTPPTLVSADDVSATSVEVRFSEAIDPVTGGTTSNYSVFVTATPTTTIGVSSATVNGAIVTLGLASSLSVGTGYTVEVQNVQDLDDNAIVGAPTVTFSTDPGVIPIATIQANPAGFDGTVVTVQGQVYIPANYRGGTTFSGYIQDASGRGINVFGTNNSLLNNVTNIVRVTGTVDLFFTTVEILSITDVTLISTGNPELQPTVLTTGAAASPAWEGTFIQVTGPITAKATSGPGINYTVNDGSGNIDVRVVTTLGVSEFNVGERIVARGAGGQFQTTFQILVGRTSDVFIDPASDTTPPTLVSATGPTATSIDVRFSETVDPTTSQVAGNYAVYETAAPGNTRPVTAAVRAGTGNTVTLTLGSAMTVGVGYTVRVNNVEDLNNNVIAANSTVAFTYGVVPTTPIADIQADPTGFQGQIVTVQGQVYVPANYRGTTFSGYIQDASGRGINLFGSGADNALLNDVTNIVRVTGTVELFFTTVEILDITEVTLISTGNPELQPQVLSTGAAADATWEGTYIQVTGDVLAKVTGGPGLNYTVNDGSGQIVVRVVNTLGAVEFNVGDTITGRGAGGFFSPAYQVNVGRAADVFLDSGGPDTTPPTLVRATGPTSTRIDASFSESLSEPTAEITANYQVFETVTPANTIAVLGAVLQANQRDVQLTLGAALVNNRGYSVRVSNVQDVAGNTIAANSTTTFTFREGGTTPIREIQENVSTYNGQVVTVEAQVYIPWDYRDTVVSGYVQDTSGRGINIFSFDPLPNELLNLGTIARITGTVELFNTTVELADITNVTVVSTGNPPLLPTPLSIVAASNAQWEGTFIQVTGDIVSKVTGGPGLNYTLTDGNNNTIVIRVVLSLGAPEFDVGQTVTARGAGGRFGADFQILVGTPDGFFEGAPTEDIFPPALEAANLLAPTTVQLRFNEPVESTSATTPGNYDIFRTANASQVVAVSGAAFGDDTSTILLTLATGIDAADGWSVRVRNVQDLAGNAIPAAGTPPREIRPATIEEVTLTGPAKTFLPRIGEAYPLTFTVPTDVTEPGGGEILLRIFDVQGRLRRTLFDSRFENLETAIVENRADRPWDGRDNFAELVSAGTYIAHLLVVDSQTGRRQEAHMPVVVATRLDR